MQEKPDVPGTEIPGAQRSKGWLQGYRPLASRPKLPRITLDRIIRFLLGVGVIALAVWLLSYFAALIIYLVLGLVVAYMLRPLVNRLQGVGMARIPAILGAFLIVLGIIALLLTFLVPFVGRQVGDLTQQVSRKSAVQITGFLPGMVQGRAALEPGYFIVKVDGEEIREVDQLQAVARRKRPGESVRLEVEDTGGHSLTVSLTLAEGNGTAELPGEPPVDALEGQPLPAFGFSVRTVIFSDIVTSFENQLSDVVPMRKGAVVDAITSVFETLFGAERITQVMGSIVGFFTDVFYAVIVIPFVAFFILKDGSSIRQSLLRLVPNRYFEITLAINEKIETNIGRYFKGLLIQCLSIGTVATVLLSVVGLKSALAVGIFAGLANTIPYFGPLMGFLAGTLVGIAQTGDFSLVVGILIAMGLTQIADNVLFQPLIFSRAAQAHPLVILFVVLIGAQLGGIIGMLVAIPLITIVRVTVQQILWSLRNYRILQTTR